MDSALIPGVGDPGDQLRLARLDYQGLGLTSQEAYIASRLTQGPLSAEDLLRVSGLPRPDAIGHVSRLISRGVVQKITATSPQPPGGPSQVVAAEAASPASTFV